MNDQPEALRVADLMAARRVSRWSAQSPHLVGCKPDRECIDAARLLREQHEEIEQLRAQLSLDWEMISEHRAEIKELREANETFGRRQEWWNEKMFDMESEIATMRAALEHLYVEDPPAIDAAMGGKP